MYDNLDEAISWLRLIDIYVSNKCNMTRIKADY